MPPTTTLERVSSAFVRQHEPWVRRQAQSMVRHLPASVERDDLVQAGLLAIATSATTFEWGGDPDSEEGRDAFVRYARMRVKGAMLDELRASDYLSRGDRRLVKLIRHTRERHQAQHGSAAPLGLLCTVTRLQPRQLDDLLCADLPSIAVDSIEDDDVMHPHSAADAVEAAVDRECLVQRMRELHARLSDRERAVLDAYVGGERTPIQTAADLGVTPSRVSQMFNGLLRRIAPHAVEEPVQRSRPGARSAPSLLDAISAPIQQRTAQFDPAPTAPDAVPIVVDSDFELAALFAPELVRGCGVELLR